MSEKVLWQGSDEDAQNNEHRITFPEGTPPATPTPTPTPTPEGEQQ